MFNAIAPTLDGETKAGGVGKLGVFGFGINVVVQLQLSGGEHHHVLRTFIVLQNLLCRDNGVNRV